MSSSANILQILLFFLVIKTTAGKAVPSVSSRLLQGCDKACQTECLEVLNEYRTNHDAPKLQFAQTLAAKAQVWADGGKFGYDMDARGKYGQLIEWDVKDELPSFKSVIKHWHDKERDYDFEKGKSKNGKTLHDFTQVVWKKAHQAGCGRGKMFGSRYYVVWMDADGVISPNISGGSENVGPPKREDIHWFEITKIKAVGEPLYWNATNSTNSTKPMTGDPKLRQKSSILSMVEEDLNAVGNEEHVLNDVNNIKEYVHDSLSKVFADENKEVAKLRELEELEELDGVPNSRLESYSQTFDGSNNGRTATNSAYADSEESSEKQVKPGTEKFKSNEKLRNPLKEVKDFPEHDATAQNNSKSDDQVVSLTQQQVPMEKLPTTVEAGETNLTESTPTTIVHEELNISDVKAADETNKNLQRISSKSPQAKVNQSAGKRHGDELNTSQENGIEMAGIIMGKLPDNGTDSDINHASSKDKDRVITNDENMTPDLKNELSKVAKYINTRLKVLSEYKSLQGTPRKEQKYGLDVKEQGKVNEPQARPARITLVGAPLSFPEKKSQGDVVKDIHEKVTALWTAHLKSKKEKDTKEKVQSKGEDDPESQYFQDGARGADLEDSNDSSATTNNAVQDFGKLQRYQNYGKSQHQETSPDNYDENPMNEPQAYKMQQSIVNQGNGINGYESPMHLRQGGGWLGGPAVSPSSPEIDDPVTHAMNMGPGGLYDYRKKYTNEDPEKDSDDIHRTEEMSQKRKYSLQTVMESFEDKDNNTDSTHSEAENKPTLQPIIMPKKAPDNTDSTYSEAENKPTLQPIILPKKAPDLSKSHLGLKEKAGSDSEDHHDLLALPKELTEHFNKETSLANELPDMINDIPLTSKTQTEDDDQPGYFNQELGLNSPTFVDQNDHYQGYHPSNTGNPYYQSGHAQADNYPMQQSTPVVQNQAISSSYDQHFQKSQLQDFVPHQQSINQGYGYNQPQTASQPVQQQTFNQRFTYPQQRLVQGSIPQQFLIKNGNPEQRFNDTQRPKIQKILKGVTLPSSMGVILDNQEQQSGHTLPDKNNHDSTKDKLSSQAAQEVDKAKLTLSLLKEPVDKSTGKGGGSTPSNKNNAGGLMNMPQMKPQQGQGGVSTSQDGSSNGTMITVKGPHKSSGVHMAKGPFVYQTDTTVVMGGPPNADTGSNTSMNAGGLAPQFPNSNPQNVPPSVGNSKEKEHKQDKNNASGIQFKRPSLITLLKEAEMINKTNSTSKPAPGPGKNPSSSTENEEKSSTDNENNERQQAGGSTSSEEKPEGSGESKKQANGSLEKGKQSEAPLEESGGSSEIKGQRASSAEGEKQQQGPTEEEKQPGSSLSSKRPSSSQNEEQPEGSSQGESVGSSKGKERPGGSSESKEEPSGSLGSEQQPASSQANEKQPSGSIDNEEKPSGSKDNEKQLSGSVDNEKQPSGSTDNEKQLSGSTDNEKQPSSSIDNEKQPSGSVDNEKQLSGSTDNGKQPSGSVDNEKQPSGSINNEKQPSGSIDNEKQPSGSKDNEKQPSGSRDNEKQPSGSKDNEKQPSGSIDNEKKPSGSKDNEKQPSGSRDNEKQPSGSMDNEKQGAVQSEESAAKNPSNIHTSSIPSEGEQTSLNQHKAKLLIPFSSLISKINHALGLDSPNSTLKVNNISLSSKNTADKSSPRPQTIGTIVEENHRSSQESQSVLKESTEKQFAHYKPTAVDLPDGTIGNTANGLTKPLAENNHGKAKDQDSKVDRPEPLANNKGSTTALENSPHGATLSSQKSHHPSDETQSYSSQTPPGIHRNEGQHSIMSNTKEGHPHTATATQEQLHNEHLSPSGSITDMVGESQSTGAPQVHEINDSTVVEYTHPGSLNTQSCTDDGGERCSLWQRKGYCNSVSYTGFMKQHCKFTCGYCALPTVELQSERAKGIKYAYGEQVCKDSPNFEFSCPEWRAQGYCQKKEKEMRRFCSNTCNFCKRKKISKKKKKKNEEQLHDQPVKTGTSTKPQSNAHALTGNSSGQPQNYANAQTGQGQSTSNAQAGNTAGQQYANAQTNSPQEQSAAQAQTGNSAGQQQNYAHAQTGNASNPQSTAYAQGGSTYVQTQSSSSQQTGYAVAQAAASPEQQTYANAQTSSPSGQPSTAYAQNTPSSKNQSSSTAHVQTGSSQNSQNVAHAQTAPVNDEQKHPSKTKKPQDGTIVDAPHSRLHGMTLEEHIMNESPEYKTANSQYFVETGDSEEGSDPGFNSYADPPAIRFSNKNADKNALDDTENKAGFSKEDFDEIEANTREDERVKNLVDRFDPEAVEQYNDVTEDDSTAKTPDKKGTLDFVSTEGCNQSCQKECLDAINSYRRNHNARPLILDQDLAEHAQGWADRKTYGRSPWAQRGMGGELIAVGSFYKTFTAAVKAWHDEEKDFDWTKGKLKKGSVIKHFKQLISKDAHVVGCGKSLVNGEPYYIAQMDAAVNDDTAEIDNPEKREMMEKPVKPDLGWYMDSSPYWKDLQARQSIPNKVHRSLP